MTLGLDARQIWSQWQAAVCDGQITCTSHSPTYTPCEQACDKYMTQDTLYVLQCFSVFWGWRWMARETAAISIHLQFLVVTHQADSWLPPTLPHTDAHYLLSVTVAVYTFICIPKTLRQIREAVQDKRFVWTEQSVCHTLGGLEVQSLMLQTPSVPSCLVSICFIKS